MTPTSNGQRLTFDGVSGELLPERSRRSGASGANDVLMNLHEGLFAGPALRWLYFLSGLLGTAMIGVAAYFWANRLIPVEMPGRAEWEMHVFVGAACC